jgi:1-hydroxycarotenoid 3,4-desaturase
VIEAAPAPGGKARALPSAAGPVDAGPTVLTLRHVFDDLFALLGESLDDHVTLVPQPILARHWWPDGTRLDLYPDVEANAGAIEDFAGAREALAFRRFHAATAALYDAFEAPVMRAPRPHLPGIAAAALRQPALWPALMPWATLGRMLRQRFRDPRLRQLFGRYATYVGGLPDHVPAVLGLVWQAESRGVWGVEGGMHRLAAALAALAARAGASFRYDTRVERIVRQGGRVAAVETDRGPGLACDHVVFNGDPRALAEGLLGEAPRRALPRAATAPRSLSARVWAFAARAEGLPLVHHNLFFAADAAAEFGPLAIGRTPAAPTLYLCAEDRLHGRAPAGTERFEIILNAPAGAGAEAPPDPPDPDEADRCRTTTFRTLDRFGLRLDPWPDTRALTQPSDLARLFPGSQGAIYGRSPHGALATFRRPTARTLLPGLWLAGGGAHPGAGVPMAALSGMHAAAAILSDRGSTSASRRTAMPGGTSTASRMTERAPSR